jgi:hypothetical protein
MRRRPASEMLNSVTKDGNRASPHRESHSYSRPPVASGLHGFSCCAAGVLVAGNTAMLRIGFVTIPDEIAPVQTHSPSPINEAADSASAGAQKGTRREGIGKRTWNAGYKKSVDAIRMQNLASFSACVS